MTTLSTHDTKRAEDVRARISVISEIPHEWSAAVRRWNSLAPLSDEPLAHLVWQAAVGAWPIERDRLHAYAEKAAREAGVSTGWIDSDTRSRNACMRWSTRSTTIPNCTPPSSPLSTPLRRPGWSNSLSAKLIQLTAPGVPDVYQGTELWDFSLVDPDNRRPVDYAAPRGLLARLDDGWLPDDRRAGRGQAAGHQPGAAVAPGSAGAVLRLHRTDRNRAGRRTSGRVRPRRRGDRRHPAPGGARGRRRLAGDRAGTAGRRLDRCAHRPGVRRRRRRRRRAAGHLPGGAAGPEACRRGERTCRVRTTFIKPSRRLEGGATMPLNFRVWAPQASTVNLVALGRDASHEGRRQPLVERRSGLGDAGDR